MSETAARWARVSSKGQDETKDLAAIDAHIAGSGRYLPGPALQLHGRSATKGEHEAELHATIERMAAGEFSAIIAVHSDRISRKDDLNTWLMLADAAGGRFVFLEEPGIRYDPTDLGAKIVNVAASHANWEKIQHLKAQVKRAHEARKERGSVVGKVGWGYAVFCTVCQRFSEGRPECRQHDKIPAPTEAGIAWIRPVYDRALQGWSLSRIAAWLNAEGVKTNGGKNRKGEPVWKWTDAGVRQLLVNPIYTGRHVYADGRFCECEALVSADMQAQAIKALGARLRRGQRTSKTLPALLIPTCLDCGGKAYRTATGSPVAGRGYAYYCRTCRHQVDAGRLESVVYGLVLAASDYEDETVMEWVEGSDSASERAELTRQIRALDMDADGYDEEYARLIAARRALPAATPGYYEERPTGRSKAEAVAEASKSREAMRELLKTWGVQFARAGDQVRVKIDGWPVATRTAAPADDANPWET